MLGQKDEIRQQFDLLFANTTVVCRPKSHQWRFFYECGLHLLGSLRAGEYADLAPAKATQYKFETERKLRGYYLRTTSKVSYVFKMVHQNDLEQYGMYFEKYPVYAGYALLVRKMEGLEHHSIYIERPAIRDYLEKRVAEAMALEFAAYLLLPTVDQESLSASFAQDSTAMKEILTVLQGVAKRGWILHNPMNPSTYRLLSITVETVTAEEATVATREYWYLKWWDMHTGKYTYPYRETNRQIYILKCINADWFVFQNLKPAPRSSQPQRWLR